MRIIINSTLYQLIAYMLCISNLLTSFSQMTQDYTPYIIGSYPPLSPQFQDFVAQSQSLYILNYLKYKIVFFHNYNN